MLALPKLPLMIVKRVHALVVVDRQFQVKVEWCGCNVCQSMAETLVDQRNIAGITKLLLFKDMGRNLASKDGVFLKGFSVAWQNLAAAALPVDSCQRAQSASAP